MKNKQMLLLLLLLIAVGCMLCGCLGQGETVESETEGKHTHAAASWKVTIPPSCTSEGYAEGVCVQCGESMVMTIPKTAHGYTEEVFAPTCEAEGFTRYTCACGYTYDGEHIPSTGHSFTEEVFAPTCEAEGFTRYTCACGYGYEGHHIPPTGHTLSEAVTVPPTCTEEGYTRFVCAVCTYEREGNPVPALAHANATAEIFYATVNRDGFTRHTCPDCGAVFDDSYVLYKDIVSGAYVDRTDMLMQGVDTSKWNHDYGASLEDVKPLDWEALRAAGIQFVILKAGSTLGKDPAFERDYADAKAAGLQVGAYFYAYADTPEETAADVEMLLSWLEGKQFELPIYYDLEDDSLRGLGQERLMELCVTFVTGLQEAGYYAALYTNTEWLYNLLDTDWIKEHLDVWYARYVADLSDGSSTFAPHDRDFTWKDGTAYKPGEADRRFGVWQYTQYGRVDGFRYRFDFNFAFKDYKSVMVEWGLNGM